MILLDTNVCVRILRGRQEALVAYSRHAGNAATALSLGCPLATENRKHFERFAGLQIDDWRAA